MGVRYPSVATIAALGIYGAAGAEAIVFTTPPLNISLDFAQVILLWYVQFNTGAGTTSYVPRIRRGAALTGALVNIANAVVCTAATVTSFSGVYVDTPGAVAGQQYSLSLSGNATTGAAVFADGSLLAFAL